MGDRIVIGFQTRFEFDQNTCLYLYCHWSGFEALHDLVRGIRIAGDAGRLNDTAYLNRICIDQITAMGRDGTLNFGLEVGRYCMPDYPVNYVLLSHPQGHQPPHIVVTSNSELGDQVVRTHSLAEFDDMVTTGAECAELPV